MSTIYATPGSTVGLLLQNYTAGLAGTLTFRLVDGLGGTVVIAESAVGITETSAGNYLRTITTPANAGTYLAVWRNPVPNPNYERTTVLEASPLPVWAPTLQDVANMRRTRLKGGQLGGSALTTFDATTNPTADAVAQFIQIAVRKVKSRVGDPTNPDVQAVAKDAAVLYACMLIELSNLTEQTSADRTPYDRFKALYDETIKDAVSGAQEVAQGGAANDSDDIGLPTHTFGTGRLASGEPF